MGFFQHLHLNPLDLGGLNYTFFLGYVPAPILANGGGFGNKRVAYAPTNGPQNVELTLFDYLLLEPNEAKTPFLENKGPFWVKKWEVAKKWFNGGHTL